LGELLSVVRSLVELGGWGALLLVGVGIAIGGLRRKGVWGWQFDLERERSDRLEAATARNTEAMERLSRSVDTIVEAALQDRVRRG
jgi:hypothetical protein